MTVQVCAVIARAGQVRFCMLSALDAETSEAVSIGLVAQVLKLPGLKLFCCVRHL